MASAGFSSGQQVGVGSLGRWYGNQVSKGMETGIKFLSRERLRSQTT